jgi:hypothetical protein
MFAPRSEHPAKTLGGGKPERVDYGLRNRASLEPNPVWQTLTLRTLGVQTKLAVSQPDDAYEREADQIADHVMRMASPVSAVSQNSVSSSGPGEVQRKCAPCEEEEKQLQRKEQRRDSNSQTNAPPSVNEALGSAGRPLEATTRSFMELRFGHDFHDVRVHDGAQADATAKSLNALAFTVGRQVVFRSGYYIPHSADGQRLLAHELAHVVQQRDQPKAIQRMIACPETLADSDSTPEGWQDYHGNTSWFHCGFRVILENRSPTPDDPQNECVYDHSGRLVDLNHAYAGCRGTPNQYDSAEHWARHTFQDTGGIWHAGGPAFVTSRIYPITEAIGSAIRVVSAAGRVVRSLSDALGEALAVAVLNAQATVDPGNWVFQGLPARSIRHLNVMGSILGSASWAGNVDTLLRNLTRRLGDFNSSELLIEIAQDINQVLRSRDPAAPQVTAADLGDLSLLHLVDWLRERGLLQYSRAPLEIARERYAAERSATP